MKDAQLEILTQAGTEHLDVSGMLAYGHVVLVADHIVGVGIFHRSIVQIRIVGDIFYSRLHLCSPAVDAQLSFNACTHDFTQVIVPPVMFGVEMTVVERRIQVLDIGIGFQTHGVVEQAEVQVTLSFYTELSGIFSNHGYFTQHIVVQCLSL